MATANSSKYLMSGGNGGGDTRVPIPNTTVKTSSADDTWGADPWESRTPPGERRGKAQHPVCWAFSYARAERKGKRQVKMVCRRAAYSNGVLDIGVREDELRKWTKRPYGGYPYGGIFDSASRDRRGHRAFQTPSWSMRLQRITSKSRCKMSIYSKLCWVVPQSNCNQSRPCQLLSQRRLRWPTWSGGFGWCLASGSVSWS